jgi:RecB family endonuclease NucS
MEVLKVIDTRIPESELQATLDKNLEILEEGLKHLDSYVNIGIGQVDSLAIDINNNLVIIEYKSAGGSDKDALIQALSYYTWLNENITWLKEYLRRKGVNTEIEDINIRIII